MRLNINISNCHFCGRAIFSYSSCHIWFFFCCSKDNSYFDCDKPCAFEGVDCHVNCTCFQHLLDNLTRCNVSNFEGKEHFNAILYYINGKYKNCVFP